MNGAPSTSVAKRINMARWSGGNVSGSALPGIGGSISGGVQVSVMPGPCGGGEVSITRRQAPVMRLTGETRTKFSAIVRTVARSVVSSRQAARSATETGGNGVILTLFASLHPASGTIPDTIAGRIAAHAHSRTPGMVAR
ncbi:MAG: hypothetical protein ABSA58_03455 [Acetobacteraceae bacterium]